MSRASLIAAADIYATLQDNAASTAIVNANGTGGTLIGAGNTSASRVTGPGGNSFPYAISLDGTDDYIDFDKPAGWSGYPFSMGVRCKLNAASGEQGAFSLHVSGATSQYFGAYAISSSKPSLVARNTTEMKVAAAANANTTWHFLSTTFHSATDRRFFIDGVLVASGTSSVSLPSVNKIAIGRLRTSGTAFSLGGAVAEFIADNVAWSDADHALLYNGVPLNTVEPVASQVGSSLSCTTGTWDSRGNGTLTYGYQWQRFVDDEFVDIVGATSSTYLPLSDGLYQCSVTASNDGGEGLATASNSVFVSVGVHVVSPPITYPLAQPIWRPIWR